MTGGFCDIEIGLCISRCRPMISKNFLDVQVLLLHFQQPRPRPRHRSLRLLHPLPHKP
jgi:hypothetical protein